MKLLYWLLCLFGFHDWHVGQKERRWSMDPDHNSWAIVLYGGSLLSLVFGVIIMVISTLERGDGFEVGIGLLISFAVFSYLVLFFYRHRFRADKRCLRCAKQKLDLSQYNSSKENAEKFFKDYNDVK